ncbi:MAG: WD40 repeat domain-containing serine/threonine-protein kinase, partial [bacterium]
PEQVAAKRMGLDHRTDIFSLGVVLYEMLTLARPFEGDTTEQVAHKIMLVDPPTAKEVRSKVPLELAVICGKAMEKNRDLRYGSMAELAADLRRHLANEPILARPPTALQRAGKWVKRNPTKSAVAGVAAGALVAISLLLAQNLEKSRDLEGSNAALKEEKEATTAALLTAQQALDDLQVKTEEVKRQAYIASIHAAGAAVRSGNTSEARRRLNDCPEEFRGWEWAHLYFACDLSLQTLEGHESTVTSVAWNPTGTRIASGSGDKTLRIWDAATGTSLQTLEGHESGVTSVAWNSAGTRIVSGSFDNTLRIWDAATGTSLQTLEGHGREVTSVAWNPAGTRIVSGS